MSRIIQASELAENALRHIGEYSINDTGAEPVAFDNALGALDRAVAELVGSMRVWWLVPASATFTINPSTENFSVNAIAQTLNYDAETTAFTIGETLTGGGSGATGTIVNVVDAGTTGSLELVAISGTFQDDEAITDGAGGAAVANGTATRAIAADDFNFFVSAQILNDAEEVLGTLRQVHRREYDAVIDKDFEQQPEMIYIDRTMPTPVIYIHPVVPAGDQLKMRLTWQEYATDLLDNEGAVTTGLPQAWQRWAQYQCAFDCSMGLVCHLPLAEREALKSVADEARQRLERFAEHNKVYPRRTRARAF